MAPDGRELSGLTRETRLAIIRQPENYSGTVGDTVTFSIQARGANLSYQWQVSTDGGAEWYDSTAEGYNTPAISMPLAEHNPGYLYRCRVTDGGGNVAYSTPGQIILLTETWSFIYNADGLRTGRSNGSTTYSYVYNGSSLSQMTVNGNTLYFAYDASGTPLSVTYNGTSYYYATNLQGDVTAILDGSGTAVVQYTYDAWGNILSATGSLSGTLGICNPLRYRGYVYDTETGLYYLQSRYYDPALGRFISADALASTGQGILGNNTFTYCGNNPVSRADDGGYFWDIVFDVASLIVSVVEVVQNPTDVGAWVGLALDIVDVAVPVVGGLGEMADAVNAARKATATADKIRDTTKTVEAATKSARSNAVRKA